MSALFSKSRKRDDIRHFPAAELLVHPAVYTNVVLVVPDLRPSQKRVMEG